MSSLIVFVIIYVVVVVVKTYMKNAFSQFEAGRPGQSQPLPSPLSDDEEVMEEIEDMTDELDGELIKPAEKVALASVLQAALATAKSKEIAQNSETRSNDEQATEPHGERIRLDTPEEARRAFIYSEIFNRKYD